MNRIHADILKEIQIQYESSYRNIIDRNLTFHFTSFLSSFFSKRLSAFIYVSVDQIKIYYLNNPDQWFRNAVQSQKIQQWIEKILDEKENIYVVVTYHTLQDARITEYIESQNSVSDNVVISISTALTEFDIVVSFDNLVNLELEDFRDETENEQRRFIASNEQIFVVQYRKIRSRWFARNTMNEMTFAKKTWWKKYDKSRYLQNKAENMIEVKLENEMIFKGDRYEWVIEFEEIFILSTSDWYYTIWNIESIYSFIFQTLLSNEALYLQDVILQTDIIHRNTN